VVGVVVYAGCVSDDCIVDIGSSCCCGVGSVVDGIVIGDIGDGGGVVVGDIVVGVRSS